MITKHYLFDFFFVMEKKTSMISPKVNGIVEIKESPELARVLQIQVPFSHSITLLWESPVLLTT